MKNNILLNELAFSKMGNLINKLHVHLAYKYIQFVSFRSIYQWMLHAIKLIWNIEIKLETMQNWRKHVHFSRYQINYYFFLLQTSRRKFVIPKPAKWLIMFAIVDITAAPIKGLLNVSECCAYIAWSVCEG